MDDFGPPPEAPLRRLRADALVHLLAVGAGVVAAAWFAVGRDWLAETQAAAGFVAYVGTAVLVMRAIGGHRPHERFGPANALTLARGAAGALIVGLLMGPLGASQMGFAATAAAVVILLDGVDGWIARRRGIESTFGARFDMEVDAGLIVALCALLVANGKVGAFVLVAGLARYLFVAAGRLVPRLAHPLPASDRRRAICVVQGLTLALAVAPVTTPLWAGVLAAMAVLVTIYSFTVDVVWLMRQRSLPEPQR